jgi:hypothetical protein
LTKPLAPGNAKWLVAIEPEHLVATTFRSLLAPKRLLPVSLVCGVLLLAQWRLSGDPRALPLGVLMCVSFLVIAPLSWRALFPEGIHLARGAVRLLVYGALGAAAILLVGRVLPRLLHMTPTLLTVPSSLAICCTLFWVGGWGLGRDIGFEASLRRERLRVEELAREAEHAQLLAMRSHLDPHFLFNTLNAIAEWCREDGEVAEQAVLKLSGILRAVLAGVKSPSWSLASELNLVRDLFALHLLRDPDLFTVTWDLPSPMPDVSVPPMILLPLAENAMKHGPAAGHRGRIHCGVSLEKTALRVVLENPGPYHGPRPGSDGLPTVQRRLRLAYGRGAALRITGEDERTRVELDLPAKEVAP